MLADRAIFIYKKTKRRLNIQLRIDAITGYLKSYEKIAGK